MALTLFHHPRTPLLLSLALTWSVAGVLIGEREWYGAFTYGVTNPILFALGLWLVRVRGLSVAWRTRLLWYGFAVLALNAAGTVYLHGLALQYDRLLHAASGFLCLLIGTIVYSIPRRSLWVPFLVVFVGLFVFEWHQWAADRTFGSRLFVDTVQPIERDVTEDIIFGLAGLLAAIPVAQGLRRRALS